MSVFPNIFPVPYPRDSIMIYHTAANTETERKAKGAGKPIHFQFSDWNPARLGQGNFLSKVACLVVQRLTAFSAEELFHLRYNPLASLPLYLAEETFRIGLPTSLLRPEGSTREKEERANWEGGSPKWKITANKRAFVLTVAGRAHCSGGFGNEKVGKKRGPRTISGTNLWECVLPKRGPQRPCFHLSLSLQQRIINILL